MAGIKSDRLLDGEGGSEKFFFVVRQTTTSIATMSWHTRRPSDPSAAHLIQVVPQTSTGLHVDRFYY